MNRRSKASLFLLEQLIVILVFALCAAACVRVFVFSYTTANNTRDTSNALLIAESAAEAFKFTGGDIGRTTSILSGAAGSGEIHYDGDWKPSAKSEAVYSLVFSQLENDGTVKKCKVNVSRAEDDELLITLDIAAGGGRSE
ncbi:MAG: hypothetical protein FWG36_04075 [Oscillospiraceae bacterium]|nr:hypothetical protein [Oscillospiraceae bacterium]